jgi:hypothetical protein
MARKPHGSKASSTNHADRKPNAAKTPTTKSYRSALWPFYELIEERRQTGESWQQIADHIAAKTGKPVSLKAVHSFYARCAARLAKRGTIYPLGVKPVSQQGAVHGAVHPKERQLTKLQRSKQISELSEHDQMIHEAQQRVYASPKVVRYRPGESNQI